MCRATPHTGGSARRAWPPWSPIRDFGGRAILAIAISAFPLAANGQGSDVQQALFKGTGPLTLRLEAPFSDIFRQRSQQSHYHAGRLFVDDTTASVPIALKTRGKFRLRRSTCEFPPLRIRFDKPEVRGTPFAGQSTLKLVTHCRNGNSQYEAYVLREYLLYRTYNILTDLSFNVRLARLTYYDTVRDETVASWGFFIEDEDDLAARTGWEVIRVPVVPPRVQNARQLALVDLFQYMIGNTDWNYFIAARDETECCHNVKIVGTPTGPVFAVPYDFDFAGAVNARYARPDARLPIRNVRDRYYLGLCRSDEELEPVREAFVAAREAIQTLWATSQELAEESRRDVARYLDRFFDLADDPKRLSRTLARTCREIE